MDAADLATADGATASAYAALRTWLAARDAVLRGLVHALSNRVGTVAAAGGMLEAGGTELAARVLGGEAGRLEALVAQFRLVTADPFGEDANTEPIVLADAVRDAVALHAYAAESGRAEPARAGVDDVPPVLAPRAGLLHALVVLLAAAPDAACVLRADVEASGAVRVRLDPPPSGEAAAAALWLLGRSGARAGGGGALLLPRFGAPPAAC